jgi:hypothetical protein
MQCDLYNGDISRNYRFLSKVFRLMIVLNLAFKSSAVL